MNVVPLVRRLRHLHEQRLPGAIDRGDYRRIGRRLPHIALSPGEDLLQRCDTRQIRDLSVHDLSVPEMQRATLVPGRELHEGCSPSETLELDEIQWREIQQGRLECL